MKNNNFVIITKKFWLKKNFNIINKKNFKIYKKINIKLIKKNKPKIVFFIHWSKKIPKNLYKNFLCVQFHPTNLPFGRGGSPIQNLILKSFKKTTVTAFKVEKKIDSGDIILKKKMSLSGSAQEIFIRLEKLSLKMIMKISKSKIRPVKQIGRSTLFKRRKPIESNILRARLSSINNVYNFIRMLDAEDYPKAFINFDNFKIILNNARKKKNKVYISGVIKNNDN
tara:strand:- start:425 stop:1099 length:675 start_codon:yes stop_codon:yes gene_type:complete